MMTLESSFEELNFLVICLTLRSISKWMGWCQLPTLQRRGKQPRWRAFSQRKRSRTRSVGSERSITWPIHIFQNFMKISVLDTSEVDCSNIVELRFIRRDVLLPQGELLHESSNEVECRRQALESEVYVYTLVSVFFFLLLKCSLSSLVTLATYTIQFLMNNENVNAYFRLGSTDISFKKKTVIIQLYYIK